VTINIYFNVWVVRKLRSERASIAGREINMSSILRSYFYEVLSEPLYYPNRFCLAIFLARQEKEKVSSCLWRGSRFCKRLYHATTFEVIGWWGTVAKMLESGEEREATITINEELKVHRPKYAVYGEREGVYRRLGAVSG